MGVVHRATQQRPNRTVALKVIRTRYAAVTGYYETSHSDELGSGDWRGHVQSPLSPQFLANDSNNSKRQCQSANANLTLEPISDQSVELTGPTKATDTVTYRSGTKYLSLSKQPDSRWLIDGMQQQ